MKKIISISLSIVILIGISASTIAQIKPVEKCQTCGKAMSLCPHKGKHPKPKSTKCPICKRTKCPYKGNHPKHEPNSAIYKVTFNCNVDEAKMFIDGISCSSPNSTISLTKGAHIVELYAEGYEDVFAEYEIGPSTNRNINLEMTKIQMWEVDVFGESFRMIYVKGGAFEMGATNKLKVDAVETEKPVHHVNLSSYFIGQTEVTQELWEAIMGNNPSEFKGKDKPVENVSWEDCQVFISELNKVTGMKFRLPTEAEWEYAARGGEYGEDTKFSGSDDLNEIAWYKENSDSTTHQVATKLPNVLDIFDMTGNVWEWCQDNYGTYNGKTQTNPIGPSIGVFPYARVHRGGSWLSNPKNSRLSFRSYYFADIQDQIVGFRLALDDENTSKFRSSEPVIEIDVTETRGADLINGSGDYVINCDNSTVDVIAIDDYIVITGIKSAVTTVTIEDKKTGCQAAINVIVHEPHEKLFIVHGVPFVMSLVEGGTFMMGDSKEAHPVHEVSLSSYRIGKTEVTQELWDAVMGNAPSYFSISNGYPIDLQRPVEQVSWDDCQEFIFKLNELTGEKFRLPTEAEWEYAARGGKQSCGFSYSGNDILDDSAWYSDNCEDETHAVSLKCPNELGLYDMTGNVWEWCQDWMGEDEENTQPTTEQWHAIRGGGWNSFPSMCDIPFRQFAPSSHTSNIIGLRLAL